MKDISRVEQSERVNYDIAEGMINYTINRLKETSESFNKKFEEDSRDYAHSRTNTIIKYLKDNDLYSLESEEIVKNNTLDLGFELSENMKIFLDVSLGLNRIVDAKFGEEYLKSLRRGKDSKELETSIKNLTTNGEVLSNSELLFVRKLISDFEMKLFHDLNLSEKDIKGIKEKLDAYNTVYLVWLKNNNLFMYGNFVNMLNTLKTYLTNYVKSKDELVKATIKGDELGAVRTTSSIIDTIISKRNTEDSYLSGVKLKVG